MALCTMGSAAVACLSLCMSLALTVQHFCMSSTLTVSSFDFFDGFQPEGILLFAKTGKDGSGETNKGDGPTEDFTSELILRRKSLHLGTIEVSRVQRSTREMTWRLLNPFSSAEKALNDSRGEIPTFK